MRNAIYRMVADDIEEVSIIGRKLDSRKATSKDHAWLWDTMAKHPLGQTCRQLRQEFDPIHQRRALTAGVTQYRLELENFDVDRIKAFAKVIRHMPKVVQAQVKENIDGFGLIIRSNLTDNIFRSLRELRNSWRDLDVIFPKLRRALGIDSNCRTIAFHEVNLNFKNQTMSSAQKKKALTQREVAWAKKKFKGITEDASQNFWRDGEDQ
jgi:hypothetical protein